MRLARLSLLALCLALSCLQAGGFVLHLRTDCPLSARGEALWANWTLAFNKAPFLCYDAGEQQFAPCGLGASFPWNYSTAYIADQLNQLPFRDLQQAAPESCQKQIQSLWPRTGARQSPPSVRISPVTPQNTPLPTMLACNTWGFYPEEVTLTWLWNGDPVTEGLGPLLVWSNGDWTYQARQTLPIDPQRGGIYTCQVAHPSLPEPVTDAWAPGLALDLRAKVGVSVFVLVVGVALLIAGLICRERASPEGYDPIQGSTYPEGE